MINISSFLGRVPLVSNRSVYSAAKSAVNVLTANLRMDPKAKYPKIKVSLVMPRIVDTDFHRVAGTIMAGKGGGPGGAQRGRTPDRVAKKNASLLHPPHAGHYTQTA